MHDRGHADDKSVSNGSNDGNDNNELYIFLKNARSLSSEERFEELMAELDGIRWDAIMLNETWRPHPEERDVLHNGHLWFGSGGEEGKRGVGVLLHKDLGRYVCRWVAINSRIGVLELNFNKTVKITLVVVYMPHAGYIDGA
eukprot:200905-Karenia_brevis.AAC.1